MNEESCYFDYNGAPTTWRDWLTRVQNQELRARDNCTSPEQATRYNISYRNYCTLIEDLDRIEAIRNLEAMRDAINKETPNESDVKIDTSEPYVTGEFMSIVDAARYADAWRVGWTEIAQERQIGSVTITATIRRASGSNETDRTP